MIVFFFLPRTLYTNPTASSCWEDNSNDTRDIEYAHSPRMTAAITATDLSTGEKKKVSPTSVTHISYQTWRITTSPCQRESKSFPSWLRTWWRWKVLYPSHIHPTDNRVVVQNSGRVTSLSFSNQHVLEHYHNSAEITLRCHVWSFCLEDTRMTESQEDEEDKVDTILVERAERTERVENDWQIMRRKSAIRDRWWAVRYTSSKWPHTRLHWTWSHSGTPLLMSRTYFLRKCRYWSMRTWATRTIRLERIARVHYDTKKLNEHVLPHVCT